MFNLFPQPKTSRFLISPHLVKKKKSKDISPSLQFLGSPRMMIDERPVPPFSLQFWLFLWRGGPIFSAMLAPR